MIQRFERQRRMPEIIGNPRNRVMAGIAFLRGNEVSLVLASRDRTVVAGGA